MEPKTWAEIEAGERYARAEGRADANMAIIDTADELDNLGTIRESAVARAERDYWKAQAKALHEALEQARGKPA